MSTTFDWSKVEASEKVPEVDQRTIALIQLKRALDKMASRIELDEAKLRG